MKMRLCVCVCARPVNYPPKIQPCSCVSHGKYVYTCERSIGTTYVRVDGFGVDSQTPSCVIILLFNDLSALHSITLVSQSLLPAVGQDTCAGSSSSGTLSSCAHSH